MRNIHYTSSCMAIIPARAGSKGVPDKNIRELGDHPLLAWSIAAAKLTRNIERVVVSTDSTQYAEIAKKYGAEVPFLRPAVISTDTSKDRAFFEHAAQWFVENEDCVPDMFVHLRPTTPLREPERIDQAIRQFLACPAATSLRSAHEADESPAKWFRREGESCFEGLLGNDWLDLPRQQCPVAYIPDGYVDIVRTQTILEGKHLYFPHMMAFVSPPCCEVDTIDNLSYLQYQITQGHPLLTWLQAQL